MRRMKRNYKKSVITFLLTIFMVVSELSGMVSVSYATMGNEGTVEVATEDGTDDSFAYANEELGDILAVESGDINAEVGDNASVDADSGTLVKSDDALYNETEDDASIDYVETENDEALVEAVEVVEDETEIEAELDGVLDEEICGAISIVTEEETVELVDSKGFGRNNINNFKSINSGAKVSEEKYVISVWGPQCLYKIEGKQLEEDLSNNFAKAVNDGEDIIINGGSKEGRLDVTTTDGTKYVVYNYSSKEEFAYLYELFHGKIVSVMGDSISTLRGNMPSGYEVYNTNIPYDNMYWGDIYTRFGAVGSINAWSGSSIGVAYHAMYSWDRLKGLAYEEKQPDIILYYGGSNRDCDRKTFNRDADCSKITDNRSYGSIEEAYPASLNRIRQLYPKAMVVQIIPYYYKEERAENQLVMMAEDFGIEYVDLRELKARDLVIERNNELHPNATGHKQIAAFICEKLYEDRGILEAELDKDKRTITFDAATNGGQCTENGINYVDTISSYIFDINISSLKAYKKYHFFKGWYTQPVNGTLVNASNISHVGFTTTLYAQFELCEHLHLEKRNEKNPTFNSDGYTGDFYCADCGEYISIAGAVGNSIAKYSSTIKGCAGSVVTNDLLPENWVWKDEIGTVLFPEEEGIGVCTFAEYVGDDKASYAEEDLVVEIMLLADEHVFHSLNNYMHKCEVCGKVEPHKFNSDYECTVEGCGEKSNSVIDGDIPAQFWVTGISDYGYTGMKIEQTEMKVYWNCKLLNPGTDYTVKYTNNIKASTEKNKATVIITGKGNYAGTIKETFVIEPVDISTANAFDEEITVQATGKILKPTTSFTIEVAGKNVNLKSGTDYMYEFPEIINKGEYEVKINGNGNYTGTKSFTVKVIDAKVPVAKLAVAKIAKQTYTGEAIEPEIKVMYKNAVLEKGKDYNVAYSKNTEVGTAMVTITGVDGSDYEGSRNLTFVIAGTPITKATVDGIVSVTYTGDTVDTSGYSLYIKETKTTERINLTPGVDYDVKVERVNAGTATAVFTGKKGYTGVMKKNFAIKKASMADGSRIKVSVVEEGFINPIVEYQKNGAKPAVIVKDGSKTLTEGVDYTVKYVNNKAVTSASAAANVIAVGKGNYTGNSSPAYFTICNSHLSNTTMTAADIVWQDKPGICKPAIKLIDANGVALKAGVDYDTNIEYSYEYFTKNIKRVNKGVVKYVDYYPTAKVNSQDIIPAGTVIRATVEGKGAYTGNQSVTFRFVESNISNCKVVMPNMTYTQRKVTLDNSNITVTRTVKGVKETLILGTDFEIVGYANNINKGIAKVMIRGIGNYGGIREVSFRIVAKSLN